MSITEGQKAPDFNLADQDNNFHSLSEFLGQKVLLYFYPKDMTPGCTVEAECFRDRLNELKAHNIQVLGVSADSVESHKKFADKYKLNFPILADTEKEVCEKYGVWVEKSMYGKKYMGIQRDSFLINEEGKILKHFEKVTPKDHVDQVLREL